MAPPISQEPTCGAQPARSHAAIGADPGLRRKISGGSSIILTAEEEETVSVIAGDGEARAAGEGRRPPSPRQEDHRTPKEQQEYLISLIPGVGNAVAKNLLRHFGSVERVLCSHQGGAEGSVAGGAEDRRAIRPAAPATRGIIYGVRII